MRNSILHKAAANHPNEVLQPFDDIMHKHGFEAVNTVLDYLSGYTLYIPSKKRVFLRCLELDAAAEFNGYNFHYLSRKYGLSDRHLRNIFKHPAS